jgi:hypothetical protein
MRYVTPEGFVQNEGDVQVSPGGPYRISYLSIVSKAGECPNLLVPVCVSSSHIAYGSIRMEPVFMVLGQSAATAASLAIDDKLDVQKVDYEKLRARLVADKQVLEFTTSPDGIDPKTLHGVVVDDEQARRIGFDAVSTSIPRYVGLGYRHDGNKGDGKQTAKFVPDIPADGKYDVRICYTPNANRATNVPVTVNHAGGETTVKVNQRKPPPISDLFVSVGTFRFEKGKAGSVMISNDKTDGHVIIDAVQLVPVK